MRRHIAMLICFLTLCVGLFSPLCVQAATPLDPDAEASLTLHYQKEGQAFADISVSIYRVAAAFENGTFALVAPFSSYPVNIYGITKQEQWQSTADTLAAYIAAYQVVPDYTVVTDKEGTAAFSQLKTGLYLVDEVVADNDSGTYVFNRFMVYLPTLQEDDTFAYDIEAKPKCVNYVPKTEYRVTKLWQDEGYQEDRPQQVVVDIYKNGELQETQTLNADNLWSFAWYVSEDDHGEWSVIERTVSENYTVSLWENGGTFSILNTHKSLADSPESPDTGHTTNWIFWILLSCVSGGMLIVLGVYGRRKRDV